VSLNSSRFANFGAAIKRYDINDLIGELKESRQTFSITTLSVTYLNEITLNSRQAKGLSYDMVLFEKMSL
jgi:hypothetical protein